LVRYRAKPKRASIPWHRGLVTAFPHHSKRETLMKNLLIAGAMFATIAISPAVAQGQGGYQGSPGADTAAASSSDAKHMRKHHATNDTSGGTSSIDKSGTTQEGGGAMAGAQGQEQGAGAAAAGNTGGTKTEPTRQ
jgi:hypothetical protein